MSFQLPIDYDNCPPEIQREISEVVGKIDKYDIEVVYDDIGAQIMRYYEDVEVKRRIHKSLRRLETITKPDHRRFAKELSLLVSDDELQISEPRFKYLLKVFDRNIATQQTLFMLEARALFGRTLTRRRHEIEVELNHPHH